MAGFRSFLPTSEYLKIGTISRICQFGTANWRFPWPYLRNWVRKCPWICSWRRRSRRGQVLGSSASVCVNILQTLTNYLHTPLSKHELAERAFHIARNVLGKHVGKQDEYAAAFGGLNFLSFDQDGSTQVEAMDLDADVLQEFQSNLMLFFTGAAHHSWTILQEQEDSTRAQTSSTLEALHDVKALGVRMREALQRAQLQVFGELLHAAWEAKRRVSKKISTPRIDQLYACAREHGADGRQNHGCRRRRVSVALLRETSPGGSAESLTGRRRARNGLFF